MPRLPAGQKGNEQDNRPQTIHQEARDKAHPKLAVVRILLRLQGTDGVHHHLIGDLQQILRKVIDEGLLVGHFIEVLRRHHDLWQVHDGVDQQPHLRTSAQGIHREGGQGAEAQLRRLGSTAQVDG